MGELAVLAEHPKRKRDAAGKTAMPDQFTRAERLAMLKWASVNGYSLQELVYATDAVRAWWETRRQMRTNWPRVVQRAMREGWALRGFAKEAERRQLKLTSITPKLIEAWEARNPE